MLLLEEAQQRVLALVPPPGAEVVPLPHAAGRFLAEPIAAAVPLPVFDNSAMDGYAVRAADVAGAGPANPVTLQLVGEVAAGRVFAGEVRPGTCVRLFTGSPLPHGADSVVMQEDTRSEAEALDTVQILDAVKPWEHIRLRGEDVRQGATLGTPGTRLTIGWLSLLAAAGVHEVRVGRRPVVGVLATGDELQEAGQPLGPGQIYESNRLGLSLLLEKTGVAPRQYPLVPDTLAATRAALEQVFAECDAVVTSGGASVGKHDYVKAALEELGGALEFWKVSMKPGKPFVFGRCGGKLLFGLPGNPVSALVTYLMLARPALLRWQGATEIFLPAHPGELVEPLVNRGDRRHFMRVKLDSRGQVHGAGLQASHAFSSLAEANGLVDVPPNTTFSQGASVQVLRWD